MELNILVVIAFIIFVIGILLLFFLTNKKLNNRFNALSTQIESYEFVIDELKLINHQQQISFAEKEKTLHTWQAEHQQVSQQLEHRIKVIQERCTSMEESLSQIQQQQPEDKLYSRAQKMVRLGADIEEIVRECELPHAEAEMLIALNKKQAR